MKSNLPRLLVYINLFMTAYFVALGGINLQRHSYFTAAIDIVASYFYTTRIYPKGTSSK